jgi:hypothetical protein
MGTILAIPEASLNTKDCLPHFLAYSRYHVPSQTESEAHCAGCYVLEGTGSKQGIGRKKEALSAITPSIHETSFRGLGIVE